MRMATDTQALEAIARRLKDDDHLQKQMTPIFQDAVQEFKAVAFQQAPRSKFQGGQLAESIAIKYNANPLIASVGILDKTCPYAKYVYFGTRDSAKPILPKVKKALFFAPGGTGDKIFRGSAKHKGQRANPFLMKSWDSNYPEFVKTLGDGMETILNEDTKP